MTIFGLLLPAARSQFVHFLTTAPEKELDSSLKARLDELTREYRRGDDTR